METAPGAKELLTDGDRLMNGRKYPEALERFQEAVAAAEAEGDENLKVHSLAQLARSYSLTGRLEEGRPFLEQAGALATPEQPGGWWRYQQVTGIFQRESGLQQEAVETFTRLYDFCLANEMPAQAVDAAHHVAIAADPDTQVAWALKGIQAAELGGFEPWLAVLWNNLGWTFDDLGRYPESLEALLKARDYHHKTGDDLAKLIADWSVGHAYRMVGRLEEARDWSQRTLELAEERYQAEPTPENAEWVGSGLREMGELALAKDRVAEARALLERGRDRLREAGMESWDPTGFDKLNQRIAGLESGPSGEGK